jgi:hypothetical protein
MSPLLFLSHSGADSEQAVALARRIEQAPEAQRYGLRVWLDKHLLPGGRWKDELQSALSDSTAFAVYVGSKGVVNWVWSEVSVALDRAHSDPEYPLIPILAADARLEALPSFLTQFQAISDVERNADAFTKLLKAVLRLEARASIEAEREPFQGLEAFDSHRTHLFFGRDSDTDRLVGLLRDEHLVMVVGDSGSGKSSVVKAGVIPRFRGGALAASSDDGPDETIWYAIETRPLAAPFEKLAEAVLEAAQARGISPRESSELADLVRSRVPHHVKDALRMTAPAGAKILMVVDQFEELFTLADTRDQADFGNLLAMLADEHDDSIRVMLTMRWDYYHQVSTVPSLYDRLERHDRRARYGLQRMTDDGLRLCVTEPLRLANVPQEDRDALTNAVLKDVGERPNALALLEMALTKTWTNRQDHGGDLLRAYIAIGRVDGALATAAEIVLAEKLTSAERMIAESLFIRLVKLGDTGGATRRLANRDELDQALWDLAQRLATRECDRLVIVSVNAEIAHEALVTSWPRYVEWLRNDRGKNDPRADDKRRLDALIEDAQRWATAAEADKSQFLARGYDLSSYEDLCRRRPAWLCAREVVFVGASTAERTMEGKSRKRAAVAVKYLSAALFVVLGGISIISAYEVNRVRTLNSELEKTNAELSDTREQLAWFTAGAQDQRDASLPSAGQTAANPDSSGAPLTNGRPNRAFKQWQAGQTLRIRFLDGKPDVVAKVKELAAAWTRHANLRFAFGDWPDADIRVGFKDDGSWSYIGTDARNIPANEPTINLGYFAVPMSDADRNRAVLHEFGHTLGLVHEWQMPDAAIPWNKEAVYRYYGKPPYEWDKATIDMNFFEKYKPTQFPHKPFDPQSIMNLPIPKEFTMNGIAIGLNNELSDLDKEYIARLYPR